MNLKVFDIEKLELFPKKISMRCRISATNQHVYHLGWNGRRHYNHGNVIRDIAYKVFKGQVGRHHSTIHRKMKEILPCEPTYYKYWLTDPNDPTEYYSRLWGGYYYFDENNILCFEPHTRPRIRYAGTKIKSAEDRKEKERESKRSKKVKEHLELLELQMINNNLLRKFYIGLCGTHDYYTKIINTPYVSVLQNSKSWYEYYNVRRHYQKLAEAKQKLPKVIDDLEKMRSGDYSPFYTSTTYLHSIGKECPHMESPHKQIL